MLNKASLIGHLGRDPEVRTMQNGMLCASFSVATSEHWRDKASGERKERTEWHRCVVFDEALVGVAEKYLKKGSKLYLEGRIQTRKWTDIRGVERYATEIVLQKFHGRIVLLDRAEGVKPASGPDDYGQGDPYGDRFSAENAPPDDGSF
jgi:single-strand DNA-binding protein